METPPLLPLPEPDAWNCQLVMNTTNGVVEGWFTTKPDDDPDCIPDGWKARIERKPLFSAAKLAARDAQWQEAMGAAVMAERAETREIMEAVWREMGGDKGRDAPGHAHSRPGIWDDDNRPSIAGKPCAWCMTWAKFTKLVKDKG